MRPSGFAGGLILASLLSFLSSGASAQEVHLHYVGSSTIGNFISDADSVYEAAWFDLNTAPESAGGELAIVEGRCDLAGVANIPSAKTLQRGVASALIGWDAIAVLTHQDNPVNNLTLSQLKGIFTGQITNWKELGGPDLEIHPYITAVESATHKVFRSVVLGSADYAGCETVAPDADILERLQNDPGGIGHLSFSFLTKEEKVKVLMVDGQPLRLTNPAYPITRPLYLLWWPGRSEVAAFVDWTLSAEGQRLVMKRFIGAREGTITVNDEMGSLVVFTPTYAVEDGGIFYYPHLPYEIYTSDRKLVRRVSNQLSLNDETPTRVQLPPGSYIIRTRNRQGEDREVYVVVEAGKLTKVDSWQPVLPKEEQAGTQNPELRQLSDELRQLDRYKSLQPYGDLRVRAEQDYGANDNRFRGRLRLRGGVGAVISPSVKVDVRLVTTSNPDDPNSPYANFTDGFNQVQLVIDRAYLLYQPVRWNHFGLWLGKMPNVLTNSGVYSELTWDDDIQPEGAALTLRNLQAGKNSRISLSGGLFQLSQFRKSGKAQWMQTAQVALNTAMKNGWELNLASDVYHFSNVKDSELNGLSFDANAGNAVYTKWELEGSDSVLTTRYRSGFTVLDNFLLLKMPLWGQPLNLKSQFIYNPSAKRENTGLALGFSWGSLSEAGQWRLYYQFQCIEQDAVFSPFVQDDFLRQTNFKGHVFGIARAFDSKISLHFWGLVSRSRVPDSSSQSRFRVDLNVKI